jgi:hypothetical protein
MKKSLLFLFILFAIVLSACGANLLIEKDANVDIEQTVDAVVMQTKVAQTVEAVKVMSSSTTSADTALENQIITNQYQNSGNQQDLIEYLDTTDLGSAVSEEKYEYSQVQKEKIDSYGEPKEFFIIFVGGDREENWVYPEIGKMYTFLNGSLVSENTIEISFEKDVVSVYAPSFFNQGTSLDMFLSVCGADEGVVVKTDELVDSGKLVYLKGLSVGFINDQMKFVQSVPVMENIE